MLEALSFRVYVDGYETEDFIGFIIQKVEGVLVKPGWSALRKVSFKLNVCCWSTAVLEDRWAELSESLRLGFLRDKYLSRLSTLDAVAFSYSVVIR